MTRPAFAPGVIEHHVRQRIRHRAALRKWLKRALALVAGAAVISWLSFLAGYHLG